MIRFEHINIVVQDIEKSLAFYKAAFPEWRIRDSGQGEWSKKPRHWCHFGDDTTYIVLANNAETAPRDLAGHQAGLAHFAFEVTNLEALSARLQKSGFQPRIRGPKHPFRANIYFIDPDGLEIEFVEYSSDLASERNSSI